MDKYYSYTDFLKALGRTDNTSNAEKLLDTIYLDLFLNHVHRAQIEEHLLTCIDLALDERNEDAFYKYAQALQQLQTTVG
ncbi:IDEAL domain-containing protein [Viridibacillus sp. YIM B01967]|uniref:IDEAL domain-containing protein n=1 Tax=Viridibacillus soli TaxID=2798301 RepID=A0ABS1H627_9BACL|nr:IDEAL domain-containing protein [Viridibacillus soli]MBK3494860.1 IDEAL domain-containing protein [Viridibacillus soli]